MRQRIDGQAVYAFIVLVASSVLLCGCTVFLKPQEKRANAQLQPTPGNVARGSVTFIERSDGVQVTYNLAGLTPDSDHALQVHERGDCNAADGSSAGEVFSPAAERLKAGARVAGDLGNIHADSNGVANGFIVAPDVSLDGVRSVLQRAVLIHRDATDPYAVAQSGAGPALACGLIASEPSVKPAGGIGATTLRSRKISAFRPPAPGFAAGRQPLYPFIHPVRSVRL